MIPKNRAPTHPGVILEEEFLKPLGMTQVALAKKLAVPIQRINTIVTGKRGVTADTALLLAEVLHARRGIPCVGTMPHASRIVREFAILVNAPASQRRTAGRQPPDGLIGIAPACRAPSPGSPFQTSIRVTGEPSIAKVISHL